MTLHEQRTSGKCLQNLTLNSSGNPDIFSVEMRSEEEKCKSLHSQAYFPYI